MRNEREFRRAASDPASKRIDHGSGVRTSRGEARRRGESGPSGPDGRTRGPDERAEVASTGPSARMAVLGEVGSLEDVPTQPEAYQRIEWRYPQEVAALLAPLGTVVAWHAAVGSDWCSLIMVGTAGLSSLTAYASQAWAAESWFVPAGATSRSFREHSPPARHQLAGSTAVLNRNSRMRTAEGPATAPTAGPIPRTPDLADLTSPAFAQYFGLLPQDTQRFLLEPFDQDPPGVHEVAFYAHGDRQAQDPWVWLASGNAVSVASATRQGRGAPATSASGSRDLDPVPWFVQASLTISGPPQPSSCGWAGWWA